MNIIAGIIIGLAAPNWLLRIIFPFIWALVFVAYRWIRTKIKFDTKVIVVEYVTAAITCLILSILIGSIIQLFSSVFSIF